MSALLVSVLFTIGLLISVSVCDMWVGSSCRIKSHWVESGQKSCPGSISGFC